LPTSDCADLDIISIILSIKMCHFVFQ